MSKYRIASVPYANAIPLVYAFEMGLIPDVEVVYDVPSRLPARLESGEVQAMMVSSIDALRRPGRRMASGVCIGSVSTVRSVRVFSKVPPPEIGTLALDASSMTSNALAHIVLADGYGAHPVGDPAPPDLGAMLADHDACVLIGDIGMRTSGPGLHVLDLGEEWNRLTGLPFVWAGWIGADGLTDELADWLNQAGTFARDEDPAIVDFAVERAHWPRELVRSYYRDNMAYALDSEALAGLHEFQRRLLAHGFEDCRHFPTLVPVA